MNSTSVILWVPSSLQDHQKPTNEDNTRLTIFLERWVSICWSHVLMLFHLGWTAHALTMQFVAWIFSLALLSGIAPESLYDPMHPSSQQLWSMDVKAAEWYVHLVETRFAHENIEACIHTLLQQCQATGQCIPNDVRILNAIDETITEIMLWAKLKCKWPKGQYEWSRLLANAGQVVIVAKWNLSNLMTGQTLIPPDLTHEQALSTTRNQIKEAYTGLRKVQRHAKVIRDSFLEDWAEHLLGVVSKRTMDSTEEGQSSEWLFWMTFLCLAIQRIPSHFSTFRSFGNQTNLSLSLTSVN
jgi:hypothetical protein